jgi:putative PIN family toxin of toxin-antitoxin system
MIVVLDTNVIISALLSSKGLPAQIFHRWEGDEFGVVTSPPLIAELERALDYPQVKRYLTLSQEEIEAFLKRFTTVASVVTPKTTLDVIEKDPADNRVLGCALAGGAEYIVSGNHHLLDLKEYKQVVILNPRSFLAVLDLAGRESE